MLQFRYELKELAFIVFKIEGILDICVKNKTSVVSLQQNVRRGAGGVLNKKSILSLTSLVGQSHTFV